MARLVALCFLAIAATAQAGVTIRETQTDGRTTVVLENDFLQATFAPDQGGECTDLVFKPTGKHMVLPGVGTLLGSRVWNYADRELYTQWQRSAWQHKVNQSPHQVRLELQSPGSVGFTRSTLLVKQITLADQEAMLRVEHTVHVGQELMQPQKIGLWFYNRCGVAGEQSSYFLPLDDRIARLDPAAGLGQEWFYHPSRGWLAAVGGGTGLAMNMEYTRLMCFYMSAGRQPTLEWAFRSFDVPNGGSLRTEELLVPFAGLARVNGSANGIVAAIETPEKCIPAEGERLPFRVCLAAGLRVAGELQLEARRLPDGNPEPISRQAIELRPAASVAQDATARLAREGTWVITGRLISGGRELVDFQTPVVVGSPSGPVRIAAREERIGRASERFEDQLPLRGTAPKDLELTMSVPSDHIPWARPYAKGPLRVLALTSCLNAREEVELAERLDMEILHVTAGTQSELDAFSGVFGPDKSFKVEHTNHYIREQLARPCDAILIGGLRGDLFTPEVLELLRRKVDEGVGLVYAGPNNLPEAFLSLLPLSRLEHVRRREGPWKALRPHFLTIGIPWDELPATDYAEYEPRGETLAAVGAKKASPLVVVQEGPGRGRVVALTYNTGWQGSGNWKSGVTPWVRNAPQRFKYWEYHFSLLARSLVWAAHREPDVVLEAIAVETSGPPVLTARLRGVSAPLEAEIRLSNAYGVREYETRVAASADLRAELPKDLPAGLHLADVIFRTGPRVVTWGTAAFRVAREVSLTKVAFDKKSYRAGDPVVLTVEGKADGGTIRAEMIDSFGRLIWHAEQPAALAVGSPARFTFTLPAPLATVLKARVSVLAAKAALKDGSPCLAIAETDCITLPEKFVARAWDDWESCIWGNPAGAYEREYMVPLRSKLYRDYGITTVQAAANWAFDTEFDAQVRAGFQIMPMSVSYGLLNIGHKAPKGKIPFDEARVEYQKTHDKKYLVRPVCLNDPADLAEIQDRLVKLAEFCAWLEPIGYNLGDEMGTTHYVTPFDYDFGEPSLAEFRKWLAERYSSLEALNRQWETNFAQWSDVMPMTAVEVKDRGNYSPWADHREFMDVTFSNFLRWVRGCLREKDPRAIVGMSGTQAAEAYGGYDWSRLMHAADFLQSYTHQDTIVMHRSFDGRVPRVPWYGYMSVNPQIRQYLWRCLLNGNSGGSYYVDGYMFRPDGTPTQSTRDAHAVVSEFQNGLAQLLHNAQRVNQVGLHYSHPSIRAAFITGGDALFRDNRGGWVLAIQDAGFQCEMLSTAQLEAGELAKRRYPVFVLPASMALSAGEAAALRRYVEDGGVLVADGHAGLMDEHCRTLKNGLLDDLFGVKRSQVSPSVAPVPGEARFTQDSGPCKLADLNVDLSIAEPDLRLSDGTALGQHGDTPLAVLHRQGKGLAVLLNGFLDGYSRRRDLGLQRSAARLVDNVLRLAPIDRAVRVESSSHCYVVSFRARAIQYVAVQHDLGNQKDAPPAEATVSLPPAASIWDVRAGRPLEPGAIKTEIAPGDTRLYALLPYQLRGLSVSLAAKEEAAAGTNVEYRVAVESDSPALAHVVVVEVLGPDGKPRAHYGRKLFAPTGSAIARIPLAINDTPGLWTIRASDVATKRSAESHFTVSPN
ncbi:MAG: hypothetical protein GXY83_38635 [Rhodopirellula sp.]|nr:hypothetical protein [Rhodopirellula sp.]